MVIRMHKNKNFTVMSNVHLRDKNLSLKAKGLLSLMLSLPDDWNYSIAGLCAICKENETAVKSALNELKTNRYVIVIKKLPNETNNGRIEYEYNVYEEPQQGGKQGKEKQGVENLGVENQQLENVGELNTDKTNTDKLSTNEVSTDKINTDVPSPKEIEKEKEKVDTHKCEADTPVPKKQLPTGAPRKKTKSELKQLEQDMINRFSEIASEYDISDIVHKNTVNAFKHYLERYTERTKKVHPILSDGTLEKIFETLATIRDTEYGHFDNVAEIEPDSSARSALDDMIDAHFKSEHNQETDWHMSHFASRGYLEKLGQRAIEW